MAALEAALHGMWGGLPHSLGRLGVRELVPQAPADKVGALADVEHGPLPWDCDASCLHPHQGTHICKGCCHRRRQQTVCVLCSVEGRKSAPSYGAQAQYKRQHRLLQKKNLTSAQARLQQRSEWPQSRATVMSSTPCHRQEERAGSGASKPRCTTGLSPVCQNEPLADLDDMTQSLAGHCKSLSFAVLIHGPVSGWMLWDLFQQSVLASGCCVSCSQHPICHAPTLVLEPGSGLILMYTAGKQSQARANGSQKMAIDLQGLHASHRTGQAL